MAPDGLDFDYTVDTGAALGVVRAFGDQGKTVVVLDRPLPGDIRSVPIPVSYTHLTLPTTPYV